MQLTKVLKSSCSEARLHILCWIGLLIGLFSKLLTFFTIPFVLIVAFTTSSAPFVSKSVHNDVAVHSYECPCYGCGPVSKNQFRAVITYQDREEVRTHFTSPFF